MGRGGSASRKRPARPRVPLAPMRPEPVSDAATIPEDFLLTPFPEGWRVLVLLDDRVRVRSRSGVDLAPWLPEIVAALSQRGRRRRGAGATELTVADGVLRWPRRTDDAWPTLAAVDSLTLLDLLVCRGRDVTGCEVPVRRDLLRGLGLAREPVVDLAPSWRGSATAAWAQARHASVAPQAGVLAGRRGFRRP